MTQGIAIKVSGNATGVQGMLEVLDTALNPVAIAGFLGAVVSPHLQRRAIARFRSEGDSAVGGGWVPLAQATQEIRESQGFGAAHPINRRTGELERFITQNPGHPVPNVLGATLTFPGADPAGELENKVKVAQVGGTQPGMNPTPPRPVLGIDEQDLVFVLTALATHIKSAGGGRRLAG